MRSFALVACLLALASLAFADCEPGYVSVHIDRTTGNFANEEIAYIIPGLSNDISQKVDEYRFNTKYSSDSKDICLLPNTGYTLYLYDSYGDGWSSGSSITYSYNGVPFLDHISFTSGKYFTKSFVVPVNAAVTEIKYTDAPQANNDWTQSSFDASSWTTGTIGSLPTRTATRYYVATLTQELANAYAASFDITINSAYALYLDGQLVHSTGLPADFTSASASDFTEESPITSTVSVRIANPSSTVTFHVAVEVHLGEGQTGSEDPFNIVMTPYTGSNTVQIIGSNGPSDCTKVGTGTAEVCGKIFDGSITTKYLVAESESEGGVVTITYTVPNRGASWMNGYTFVTGNDVPTRDPKIWNVYGSTDDGATWHFLDHQERDAAFPGRYTFYGYELPNQGLVFNKLKVEILSDHGANRFQMGELLFTSSSIPFVSGLQYTETSIVADTFIEFTIEQLATGMSNFSIDPALPSTITLNSATGRISGYSASALDQTYTVTATDGQTNGPTTIQIHIVVNGCTQPERAFIRVKKHSTSRAIEESILIYNSDNELVHTMIGADNTDTEYKACLNTGVYKFRLEDGGNNGWSTDSYADVEFMESETETLPITRFSLIGGSSEEYFINIKYDLPNKSTFKYIDASSSVPENWFGVDFVDSEWSDMSYTSLPTANRITLLRKTFTIPSYTDMNGWVLRFRARAGAVAYVNGVEVYRINMPAGDITSDSAADAGASEFSWQFVSGSVASIKTSPSVTIAIALVGINNNAYDLDFDAVFFLRRGDNVPFFLTAASGSASSDSLDLGGTATAAFDGSRNTRWITGIHDSVTPRYVDYTFNAGRLELVNKYCVISNKDAIQHDPVDWTFSGKAAGSDEWESLDTQTNVSWEDRYQRQCFYIPNQNKAYQAYRFTATKARELRNENRYALMEIEFYVVDYSSLQIPALTMTPANLVAYVGMDTPALLSSSPYYRNFSIEPALPEPLTLDSSNGYINGVPAAVADQATYTLTAYDILGNQAQTTFTLTITQCSSPNVLFKLVISFDSNGYESGWSVANAAGDVIDSRTYSADYSTQTFGFCQPIGVYLFTFTDESNNGWGSGKYKIYKGDELLLEGSVASGVAPKTESIALGQYIELEGSTWKVNHNDAEPASNWKEVSYNDEAWSSLVVGSIPVATTTAQYYRYPFNVPAVDTNLAGYYITVKAYAGLIVYLNGNEIYRYNMPVGAVNKDTQATAETDGFTAYSFSILAATGYLVSGNNVLAVELHKKDNYPATNDFAASMEFVANNSYRVMDGVAWSDVEKTGSEGTDKLFDNNINTKVLAGPRCVGAIYQWTYNNGRREQINQYKITDANDCNTRHPSGWNIEGSNDNGATWTLLHSVTAQYFNAYFQTFTYNIYATVPYNSYRMVVTECNNQAFDWYTVSVCGAGNLQLSELAFYMVNTPISCPAQDGWSPAYDGSYSYKACEAGYTGSQKRLCTDSVLGDIISDCVVEAPSSIAYSGSPFTFTTGDSVNIPAVISGLEYTVTIEPGLPQGLTINPLTGLISGTPAVPIGQTTFTVKVENAGGSVTTTIVMTILARTCPATGRWPETDAGQPVTFDCDDSVNYQGAISRLCNDNGNWENEVNTCVLRAITLTYPQSSYNFFKDVTINSITPILQGGSLNPLTISPLLPSGLQFNNANGMISGTPISVAPSTQYTVTASNAAETKTFVLTIVVEISKCPADGIWPETEGGNTATKECEDPFNYQGQRTRYCNAGNPGSWSSVVNSCSVIPITISYPEASYSFYKDDAIEMITPNLVGGLITSITSEPALPTGLQLNSVLGTISGTPLVTAPSTVYTITAVNVVGSVSTQITLEVTALGCAAEGEWPFTERDSTAYIPCGNGLNGIQTRLCQRNSTDLALWQSVDASRCVAVAENDKPGSGYIFSFADMTFTNLNYDDFATNYESQEVLRKLIVNKMDALSESTFYEASANDGNVVITKIAQNTTYSYPATDVTFRLRNTEETAASAVTAIGEYTNSGNMIRDLMSSGDSLLTYVSSVSFDPSTVTTKDNSLDLWIIIVIGVVVIVVVIVICIVIAIACKPKSQPKLKKTNVKAAPAKKVAPAPAPAPAPKVEAPKAEAPKEETPKAEDKTVQI